MAHPPSKNSVHTSETHLSLDQTRTIPNDWLRVSEACQYSRVSKPTLYNLLNRGLVKSVSLKERGQIKGTRLVSFHSLKAFLESKATGGIES
jgi:excisionase family DNA binding protein